jgi:hypothetical protein
MDIEESKTLERVLGAIDIVLAGYYTAKGKPWDELKFARDQISELLSYPPHKITRKKIARDLLKQPGGYSVKKWVRDNKIIFIEAAVEIAGSKNKACELMQCSHGYPFHYQDEISPSRPLDGL